MKSIRQFAAASLLVFLASPLSAADPDAIAGVLRQVVDDNLAAYNSEDPSRTLASVHTRSPAYASMQDALPRQFDALDTRTEVEAFTFIGHDDEPPVLEVTYSSGGSTTSTSMSISVSTSAKMNSPFSFLPPVLLLGGTPYNLAEREMSDLPVGKRKEKML